jgi:hypothetical protein
MHQLVPGLAPAPDEEKVPRLCQHLGTLAERDEEDAGTDGTTNLSRQQIIETARVRRRKWRADSVELAQIRQWLVEKDRQVQELSARVPKVLEPEVRDSLIEACRVQKDLCVRNGALDPATADALFAKVVKDTKGRVNTIALSRTAATSGEGILALSLFEMLKENKPVKTGEQGLTLPYAPPGSQHQQEEDEQRLRKKLLSMVNRS